MMNQYSKQQGVTLVFSLVILVTLTIIGVSSMQMTRTELAMAGNQRESTLMFQTAELALKSAEAHAQASTTNLDFAEDRNPGLTTVDAKSAEFSPDYFTSSAWGASASQEAGSGLYSAEKPRYVIEYLGDRKQNPLTGVNIGGGYGANQVGDTVSIYRNTARGVGLKGNSFRYVQSYFGKLITP